MQAIGLRRRAGQRPRSQLRSPPHVLRHDPLALRSFGWIPSAWFSIGDARHSVEQKRHERHPFLARKLSVHVVEGARVLLARDSAALPSGPGISSPVAWRAFTLSRILPMFERASDTGSARKASFAPVSITTMSAGDLQHPANAVERSQRRSRRSLRRSPLQCGVPAESALRWISAGYACSGSRPSPAVRLVPMNRTLGAELRRCCRVDSGHRCKPRCVRPCRYLCLIFRRRPASDQQQRCAKTERRCRYTHNGRLS